MDPIEPWVDCDELRRMANALLKTAPPPEPPEADATYGDQFEGYTGEAALDPLLPPQPEPQPAMEPSPRHPAQLAPAPQPAMPAAQAPTEPSSGIEQNARQALAAAREIAQRGGLLAKEEGEAELEAPAEILPAEAATAKLTQVLPLPETAPAAPPVSTPFVARLQAYGTWLREGILAKAFFVTDREGGVLIDEVQSPKLQQVARTLAQASRTANRQAGAAAIGNLHVKIAPETVLEVVPVMTRYGPLILGIIVSQPLTDRNVETVARGLQQVIDANPEANSP